MQINGTKLSLATAGTIAINLIGWGITLGTILTRLDGHDQRITRVENKVFPTQAAEAAERK